MGSKPREEEIPVEREDLAYETQKVFKLYDLLDSNWDTFNGFYMGKDLSLFPILCNELDIDKALRSYALYLIPFIDNIVSNEVSKKVKSKSSKQSEDMLSGKR